MTGVSVSFERLVRPFLVKDSRPDPAAPAGEVTDLGALANVALTWGAGGEFDLPPGGVTTGAEADEAPEITEIGESDEGPPGYTGPIIGPVSRSGGSFFDEDEEEDEDTGLERVKKYREVSRVVETVRIENPDDASQFVEVERITEIEFKGPDAWNHRFYFNHPPVTT